MNTNQMLAILSEAAETDPSLFSRNYIESRLADAVAGKPAKFSIGGTALGRNYYQYKEIVLNYTGADDEKPLGMCGKVNPSKTGEIQGVKWAKFIYDIDSGD